MTVIVISHYYDCLIPLTIILNLLSVSIYYHHLQRIGYYQYHKLFHHYKKMIINREVIAAMQNT